MPREVKIKAAIWLSGTLFVFAMLAYVINTLAKSPSESPHAYYVDSSTGDDSSSGHSPSSAWRTIGKVNSIALTPGDTVYFRRGEVWRETLEPRNGGAPAVPSPLRPMAAVGSRPSAAAISSTAGVRAARRFFVLDPPSPTTFTSMAAPAGD